MDYIVEKLDENNCDWRYWKDMYYDLAIKYESLQNKFHKVSNRLLYIQEKSKLDNIVIKELTEKIKKLSSNITRNNLLQKLPLGHANVSPSYHELESMPKSEEFFENTKLYEAFLMLSGDSEDSKIIYSHLNSDIMHQVNIKIISEFIFPTQASTQKIEMNSISDLFEILYPNPYRDKNSFVFTLKGNTSSSIKISEIPNRKKELLYCCCVLINDIKVKDLNNIHNSYLCYCILTYCPCFELHFEIIYRLLAIKKIERIGKVMESDTTSYDLGNLLEIIKEKKLSFEEIYILETYGVYNIQPSLTVRIDISELEPVDYEFPSELSHIDTVWPCPLLFSLMAFKDLMLCVFTLLQEQSVVFISKNLGFLSSCVLGVQALLKPFNWNYVISPILPEQIKDILQAPLPLLVGITFKPELLSDNITFINLDEDSKVHNCFPAPDFYDLIEMCWKDWELFAGLPCYIPTEIQKAACNRIIGCIQKFLSDLFIGFNYQIDPTEALETFVTRSKKADREFLQNFTQTQIFFDFLEEKYK